MKNLHGWDLDYKQARALQEELAGKLRFTSFDKKPKLVAGLDCAFSKDGSRIGAVIVVMRWPDFEIVETAEAVRPVQMPYVPGYLSFREGPACIAAAMKLKHVPSVFIIDGQGTAHPRRMGLASHLGLFFDRPTIGCAKSRLTGEHDEPGPEKGDYAWLWDDNEKIGAVLRTRTRVKPVYVSPGHKCTRQDAIRIVLQCTTKYKLPEPTRIAHQLVTKMKPRI
ncbi:deoxyribonuclease V [Anaerohalosphaera lusitana]|uniref:deoxyribonuclease V n=1 Tax=Anaerohalosphaera lusitana TaxID=1936003 RepID=UPI0011BA635A|nr:deoxyribonuclease V [Anaerohalosphaera lusitana]